MDVMEIHSGDSLIPITNLIPVLILKEQSWRKTFGC